MTINAGEVLEKTTKSKVVFSITVSTQREVFSLVLADNMPEMPDRISRLRRFTVEKHYTRPEGKDPVIISHHRSLPTAFVGYAEGLRIAGF